MGNCIENFNNVKVAFNPRSVEATHQFCNIGFDELLARLRVCDRGEKDGAHFLRTGLNYDASGKCLPRKDVNTQSMARVLILDCDSRMNCGTGELLEGAPAPDTVSNILKSHNIKHLLHGSHSHYSGTKGNRYRIILFTKTEYKKSQLAPTVISIITLINAYLDDEMLADVSENSRWSQPWYVPRKPIDSEIPDLLFEYSEGDLIEVVEPVAAPTTERKTPIIKDNQISVIDSYNVQNKLADLLCHYGYKKVYASKENDKYLSPNSTSGKAGITVFGEKFYSHHGDSFSDGHLHDAFDLFRITEGLSESEAIKRAARECKAQDGRTVDDWNKSLAKGRGGNIETNAVKSMILPHHEILPALLDRFRQINFRNTANLNEKDKLKRAHYQVIALDTIHGRAKESGWGFCHHNEFTFLFNGQYWAMLEKAKLKKFLKDAALKVGIDPYIARHYKFSGELYEQFKDDSFSPDLERASDDIAINLKNGTLRITKDGTSLHAFAQQDFFTYQLQFDYNPSATAPMFEKFLNEVLPDKASQSILAEFVGSVFVPTRRLNLEKVLMLLGTGANGKSVVYSIIRGLLGNENICEYSLESLTDEKGYHCAMLDKKLLNYASELSSKVGATSRFKQLASGEPIEARLPGGNPFIIQDYAKLMFNCNELPHNTEHSHALYRRLLILKFNKTIPEEKQDRQLAKKIINAELSGVLNWALAGLKRLLEQQAFTKSAAVEDALEQYKIESNNVRLFLEDKSYKPCRRDDDWKTVKLLYEEYVLYCRAYGYFPLGYRRFLTQLKVCEIETGHSNKGLIAFITNKILSATISNQYQRDEAYAH